MEQENEFIGPGKLFETEEEEFAEYIELLEWTTQTPPQEVKRFFEAVAMEVRARKGAA